jgi:predicted SAM-dependent methyltransferase
MRAFKFIDRNRNRNHMMVNIGGSNFFKRHWLIMDYRHPDSRHYDFSGMDFNYDLMGMEPFPFADNSISYFYSANTMEHVQDEHLAHIFREMRRCLKPSGAIRIQVPDFDLMYDAMRREDHEEVIRISDGHETNRFTAMAAIYGKEYARRVLKDWPEWQEARSGLWTDKEIVFNFLDFFAGHKKKSFSLQQVMDDIRSLPKKEFADAYTMDAPIDWKRQNPKDHTNWLNPEKLISVLQSAGFNEVYETKPFESNFDEMRGVGKYWGFDHRLPNSSCYIEAIK